MPGRRPSSASLTLLAVLACSCLVLAGCGDKGSGSSSSGPKIPAGELVDMTGKKTVTIDAVDNAFQDRYVKVSPGTKVVFKNDGQNPHNVLASDQGAFTDVDTDQFMPGATAEITFDDSGNFPYYCSLHGTPTRGMNAEIIVEG